MKTIHGILLLFIFQFTTHFSFAQTFSIDSVLVKHCFVNDDDGQYYTTTIDSFFSDGLIASSTFDNLANSFRYTHNYTYSATRKILLDNYTGWNGSSFGLISSVSYVYDANDSLISKTEYLNLYPTSSYRYLYIYDFTNHVSGMVHQTFDGTNWVNQSETIDSLDLTNRIYREDRSRYDGTQWIPELSKLFSYLPNDSIDFYFQQNYPYNDSTLFTFTYDSNSYLLRIQQFGWDTINASYSLPVEYWANYYDSLQRKVGSSAAWAYGSYWDVWDTSFTVYNYLNQLTYIQENYHSPSAGYYFSYTYLAGSNDVDSLHTCRWGQSFSACSDCKLEYFSLILGELNQTAQNFIVFPNPASHQLQIIFPKNAQEDVDVSIIDLESRTVLQKIIHKESYAASLSDIALPNGIYFVRIRTDKKQFSQKLIINN